MRAEWSFSHPLNAQSEIRGHSLGDAVGLERTGVHLIRIPAGKESFVYHRHFGEEEWIYVLSGRGVAEIGDQEHEVGPGDFMGFPTPSVGHNLKNAGSEDLVYLCGGERNAMELAEFPRHGKRFVRSGAKMTMWSTKGEEAFPGFERP